MTTEVAPDNSKGTAERLSGLAVTTEGFTLVETLIALFVLTFGFLAVGQILFMAAGSASLARSKGSAITLAQGKLAMLADLYRRDSGAGELSDGLHGPERADLLNPSTNSILDRFNVSWTVGEVPDPRAGITLKAKQVLVFVTPVDSRYQPNLRPYLNKAVTVSTVLSEQAP